MVTKKESYKPITAYVFLDEKRKQRAIVRNKIAKSGINPDEPGIFSGPEYEAKYFAKINSKNRVVT